MSKFDYDVSLSFACEDRDYVEQVALHLECMGIRYFYDNNQQVDLWGKNLSLHLQDIYKNKSKYCVIFISQYYKEKAWTNHECESALERDLLEKKEYILPARFDDTDIPGIKSTIGYIDLNHVTPEEFAKIISNKIKKKTTKKMN